MGTTAIAQIRHEAVSSVDRAQTESRDFANLDASLCEKADLIRGSVTASDRAQFIPPMSVAASDALRGPSVSPQQQRTYDSLVSRYLKNESLIPDGNSAKNGTFETLEVARLVFNDLAGVFQPKELAIMLGACGLIVAGCSAFPPAAPWIVAGVTASGAGYGIWQVAKGVVALIKAEGGDSTERAVASIVEGGLCLGLTALAAREMAGRIWKSILTSQAAGRVPVLGKVNAAHSGGAKSAASLVNLEGRIKETFGVDRIADYPAEGPLDDFVAKLAKLDPEAAAQIGKYGKISPQQLKAHMPELPETNGHLDFRVREPSKFRGGADGNHTTMGGYNQILYVAKGTVDGKVAKYEVRWHTKVPGSPDDTLPNWRITRQYGNSEEVLVRSKDGATNEWVSAKGPGSWKEAESAWVAGNPTAEQKDLLNRGHFTYDPLSLSRHQQ